MTKRADSLTAKVRRYLEKNPNAKTKEVSNATGATYNLIHNVRWLEKKKAKTLISGLPVIGQGNEYEQKGNKWKVVTMNTTSESIKERLAAVLDNVNHPAHYKVGGIETIDFIEAKKLNYNLGNVIKYITRADHKGDKYEDLCKARWYLNREIANLQGKEE
jgi:hypothetical protein